MNEKQNELIFPDAFNHGLTKRELFAAMAMQGMLSNSEINIEHAFFAKDSVEFADVLLKELEK